jgi:hypothetical protein
VVEHSLGKGEVESSILSGSTILFKHLARIHSDMRSAILSDQRGLAPFLAFFTRIVTSASVGETRPIAVLAVRKCSGLWWP